MTPQAAAAADRHAGAQAARRGGPDQGPRAPHPRPVHARGEDAAQGFPPRLGRQPDQPGVGRRRPQAQAEVVVGPARRQGPDRRRAGSDHRHRKGAARDAARHQGNQPRDGRRRSQGPPRQEGNGRGQPAPGDLDRQEVHQPRPAVPRPDPGRQHRPDEGGRQVRIPPRLQVLDVCDVVDPPGDHALDRRPGAHHPHPGAHDRDDQQAQPHLPPDAAAVRPRGDAGRAGERNGHARGQDPQGA